jgi:hypothetical protein
MNDGMERKGPAYYAATIAHFLTDDVNAVIGQMVKASGHDIEATQISAWTRQLVILRNALTGIDGSLFLEFDIPRLGSRIDGVVISRSAIIPIEFKVGESAFTGDAHNQAWDYALDLKNFHEESLSAPIFPVLCATDAINSATAWGDPHTDGVYPPRHANAETLREACQSALSLAPAGLLDATAWASAPYRPAPSIIEAAKALYSKHSVEAIARSDAGARNLHTTTSTVRDIIDHARSVHEKAIVFITGVPGAGKTLVGLNIATRQLDDETARAVFLSGNGPLVSVLRAALVMDEMDRQRRNGGTAERKGVVEQRVKPFIQNVHHFRDDGLRDLDRPPHEHVAIFDEAQRAWDEAKTSQFMKQRKGIDGFNMSEPQFLLSFMDRHRDWAVVVCLVGGGQDIHTGEAGISSWLRAIQDHFPHWRTYISPELHDAEYDANEAIRTLGKSHVLTLDESLHLAVSMRSFRSEKVSEFVKTLLDSDIDHAREILGAVLPRYPLVLTRDRTQARKWIKSNARGTERYGLLASSQAQRLKAYCIDVRIQVDPVKYFLAGRNDTRSSYYLEDAVTEFQSQGLELDWSWMNWDADLRRKNGQWSHHRFRGDRWTSINKPDAQRYLRNAYRVLLTRARQGMVIFVPKGRKSDRTLVPEYYDETFSYLRSLGIPEL